MEAAETLKGVESGEVGEPIDVERQGFGEAIPPIAVWCALKENCAVDKEEADEGGDRL